jgi:hypothetical protein
MKIQTAETTNDLNIIAAATSSPDDFDFLVGKWRIDNRKLNERLADCDEWTEFKASGECRKILNGFGNTDSFITDFDGKKFEGTALRLFNPRTRLWSIYWTDSTTVVLDVPQVGSFENEIGEFLARDLFDGKAIIVKFRWDATNPEKPVWSQAFSADGGKTWEWNWFMTFYRQD